MQIHTFLAGLILHGIARSESNLKCDGKVMEVLLEYGANPRKILDSQGRLPLYVACAREVARWDDIARTRNMKIIYVLFQRMIGDASLK